MNPSNVSPPSNTPDYGTPKPPSSTVQDKAQQVKAAAADSAQQLKQKVTETATHLKEDAAHMADERKREVADRIKGYSSAIHDSAKNFEQEDPNIAWFTHQAADRLQQVADYMRQRNFQELKLDAEKVARQHPGVLLGGTFVAGLLIGSLLRAGGSAVRDSDRLAADYDYDPETSPGEAYTATTPVVSDTPEI